MQTPLRTGFVPSASFLFCVAISAYDDAYAQVTNLVSGRLETQHIVMKRIVPPEQCCLEQQPYLHIGAFLCTSF